MSLDAVLDRHPALGDLLHRRPELRPAAERLVAWGLVSTLDRYLDDAGPAELGTFLSELERVDPERLAIHRRALREPPSDPLGPEDVEPVRLVTLDEQAEREAADTAAGLESLRAGRWASLAFAGGSGTRFFSQIEELDRALAEPNERLRRERFDVTAPKGVFPISPVAGLSFYERIAAAALAAGVRAGRLPWVLLLTSRVTHERSLAYLQQRDLWGMPAAGFIAFRQADEPRLDAHGDLVVADREGHLAWTGDGHGGVYRALLAPGRDGPGVLERLRADGVEQLVMHNVDNAAARPFAPARLGFHLRDRALFTVSATRKTDPEEKVGVLMRLKASGRIEVVEYNVIDRDLAAARAAGSDRLLHEAGNINTNLVAVEAITPDIDPTLYTGKRITSRRGVVASSSLEMLNQHLTRELPAARVRAYEVQRQDFFMPTKNVTGPDSVASTSAMLSQRFARLLGAAGARIDPAAICDLHPACGAGPAALAERGLGPGWQLGAGARLYLCARLGLADGAPIAAGPVTVEPGATLIVDARRPYGEPRLGPERSLTLATERASRVQLGRGLVVRAGVTVRLRIGPGARLEVTDGRVFDRDVDLELGPGESQLI